MYFARLMRLEETKELGRAGVPFDSRFRTGSAFQQGKGKKRKRETGR